MISHITVTMVTSQLYMSHSQSQCHVTHQIDDIIYHIC